MYSTIRHDTACSYIHPLEESQRCLIRDLISLNKLLQSSLCNRKRNHIKMTHLPQESSIKWPLLPARMNESVYQVPCFPCVPPHSAEHYNPPSPAAELPFSLTVIPRQLWHPAAISIQTLTLKFPSAYYWQSSSFSTTVQPRRVIKNDSCHLCFSDEIAPNERIS